MSASTEQPVDLAGLGVRLSVDSRIPTNILMDVLKDKITSPQKFLPVSDVISRTSDDGKGIYREMSLGPRRIIENIYVDEDLLEVQFKMVNTTMEVINKIVSEGEQRFLEFFLRDQNTLERLEWNVPCSTALKGVEGVLNEALSIALKQ